MCVIQYGVDVYPNGARSERKLLLPCPQGDGRTPCGNSQRRNIGERFLGFPNGPPAPTDLRPFPPAMGSLHGIQTRPPNPTPIPTPEKPLEKRWRKSRDMKLVFDFHIPFTRRGRSDRKHRKGEIVRIKPAPPSPRPRPRPRSPSPFQPPAFQPPAFQPPAFQPPPAHQPPVFNPPPPRWVPPPPPPPPPPQRRPSPATVIHHHYDSDSSSPAPPIRQHHRRRPAWPRQGRRDTAEVEINRERDRRRRAEREARHAQAAARRADEERRDAEAEAARARRHMEAERASADRAREIRNRLRLEQFENQRRIESERIREAQRHRLEADRLEEQRRLRQGWARRAPPLLHQYSDDSWREPGDDVIETSIENARRREAARRALDAEGFRRVRVGGGPRRRNTVGGRERVVYEEDYERRRFGWF